MSTIFNQLKNRSRLIIGVTLAAVALLAVTVIPFKYDDTIGYEVAFAGVNKDLALDSDKITELLHELGVQGATVDVSGCETTCNLKITDLKSLADGRILIAAFESGGAVQLANNLTPIVDRVSGNLLTRVRNEFTVAEDTEATSEETIHGVIVERLGDDHLSIIAESFGIYCDDSASFTVDFSEGNQWVEDGSSGDHALMFFRGDSGDCSIDLQQLITNGDCSFKTVDSNGVSFKTLRIGGGEGSVDWNLNDPSGIDFTSGQLTEQQIADLEAKGYSVTITQADDGQQQITLRKLSVSEDGKTKEAEQVIEFTGKGDALAKETPDGPNDPTALPEGFALSQNYPNPFNPNTKIDYTLASTERVHIDIINVMGQTVRTLVDEQVGPGVHTVEWDATDDNGRQVASGMYFYRFKAGKAVQTRKMTLLK